MTRETMRFLMKKLSKETLIESILNTYDALFKDDPEGLKTAYHDMTLKIQALSVIEGKSKVEDFFDPFKTELQEYLNKINNDSLRPNTTEEEK